MTVFVNKSESLGDLLKRRGKINKNQLERGQSYLETVPQTLGEILVSLGLISEYDLRDALSEQLGLACYTYSNNDDFLPLNVSALFHKEHPFALLHRDSKNILVTSNPLDGDILSAAESFGFGSFEIQLATDGEINKILEEYYDLGGEVEGAANVLEEADVDRLKDMASEAPVIKYVNNLIETAVERRASDIHIEAFEDGQLIRFRIDGILYNYEIPPAAIQAAIISRTKLLASLDIAERRIPQDGKISTRIGGREIDLRVSTIPTIYGEGVVIRILEKGAIILDMDSLGMTEKIESRFKRLISQPSGIILVTGPTGSGKTTTLYCALNQINSENNKIITLEDPVEYQLKGINQIQVKPEIGLSFARGLRSIVRQDPDIIMVGEIRDLDTAEIAVQSSLTGHLVFSTLHTNDALSAITRMVDIGVERFLLSSSLRGIMAQRLVRRICSHCRTAKGSVTELLGYEPAEGDFEVYVGKGCSYCHSTGYTGRVGIYELVSMSEEMCRALSQGMGQAEFGQIAAGEGFRTMFEDGLLKVKAGITTLAEVVRVTGGSGDGVV